MTIIESKFNSIYYEGKEGFEPVELTLESVADIHHSGGTILASSRGGFDCDRIISFLLDNRINQLYVIGGDGTHRGANKIAEACLARQLNIAVVGIPKTIDNDVDLIDRSFGEHTMMLYNTNNNHHVHLYTHRYYRHQAYHNLYHHGMGCCLYRFR